MIWTHAIVELVVGTFKLRERAKGQDYAIRNGGSSRSRELEFLSTRYQDDFRKTKTFAFTKFPDSQE